MFLLIIILWESEEDGQKRTSLLVVVVFVSLPYSLTATLWRGLILQSQSAVSKIQPHALLFCVGLIVLWRIKTEACTHASVTCLIAMSYFMLKKKKKRRTSKLS